MQITLEAKPFAALETDALVSYVFEEADPVQGRIADIDKAAAGLLHKLAASGELTGKLLEFTLIHSPAGLKAARLLLVGAGKREQWNGATLRKIAGAALRYLKARSIKQFAYLVRENAPAEETAQIIVDGALAAFLVGHHEVQGLTKIEQHHQQQDHQRIFVDGFHVIGPDVFDIRSIAAVRGATA